MYDHEKKIPPAILVGLNLPHSDYSFESSLEELAGLVEALGMEPVLTISQSRSRPESASYIGRGKLEELQRLCAELQPEVIVFNHELSGVQLRNLEQALELPVMDRTTLILEIFRQRAVSHEGRLQVELARLEYSLPRLTGQGSALSRIGGGGLATRGAGEQKLELDRRYIRKRIKDIKVRLQQVAQVRATQKKRRQRTGIASISLVGYTNAGKSTLFNRLCQRWHTSGSAPVEADDRLFQTLDTTTRRILLPSGKEALLSDSVGFIQDLPHHLVAAFRATLEEVVEADLLLQVVDVSDPNYFDKIRLVETLLEELGAEEDKIIKVYNKIDRLSDRSDLEWTVAVSALEGTGMMELAERIDRRLDGLNREFF